MKSLVLVLGAGASKEVNLPIGTELKSEIARLLDIRFEFGSRQKSGDYQVTEALRLVASRAKEEPGQINAYLRMCWRIDRKSTRLNSSHYGLSRMPSSA